MDAAAELGRNPVSKHQVQPKYGDEQADADRTAEPFFRDQIFRRKRGQGKNHFPRSPDPSRISNLARLTLPLLHMMTIRTAKIVIILTLEFHCVKSLDPRYGRAVLAWDCNVLYCTAGALVIYSGLFQEATNYVFQKTCARFLNRATGISFLGTYNDQNMG